MAEAPPDYIPTSIEKVFEILDTKLVSLGVPGGLSFLGITAVHKGEWGNAAKCFAGAAAVWVAIKVGKKLAPKLDQGLDRAIGAIETAIGGASPRFTRAFLKKQAQLDAEFTTEGYKPDYTAIPLLEDVFVPLELSGAFPSEGIATAQSPRDAALHNENLDIWELLRRSQREPPFRQLVIQAKGGMGKTTLLRHIALIYGQGQQGRYRAPRLVPMLLRLRDWAERLGQPQAEQLSLPRLITEHQIPKLWEGQDNPPMPPSQWAETLLKKGKALVMFDGFDEVPEAQRPQVSRWLSQQMRQYAPSVFILTSRPAGYKDYAAQKPSIPLFVKQFSPAQQADFIRRWYLCQEKCFREKRQLRQAQAAATQGASNLIAQLEARRAELGYMAENPLLLNMLVTFHRLAPDKDLPRQRLGLYRGVCKLQLEDRPLARGIVMRLAYPKSHALLQHVAMAMGKKNRLTLPEPALLEFLAQQTLLTEEEVAPTDWLKQIVEVSELLVERKTGEYEFPHASFQGFFAAAWLTRPEDKPAMQKNAQLVLQNWNQTIWRETVLLYTAQLPPGWLNPVICKACDLGSEAAALATDCLKEYPRPDKISADLRGLLDELKAVAQDSKYQTLETLLKAQQWREADQETYRLMITTVGKEEGQYFSPTDFETFPCDDLKTLDQLWVRYSQGKFGFSVQKKIWQDCGSPSNSEKEWDRFCVRVGWQDSIGTYLFDELLLADLENSPLGELPGGCFGCGGGECWWVLFSLAQTCEL
ncbi:MAG: GUN4 domain-containing protein [Nodosilinea sp.]